MAVQTEYTYTEGLKVTAEIQHAYDTQGYVIIRSLLSDAELRKLYRSIEGNDAIIKRGYACGDGHGRQTYHVIWNHPGDDVTGRLARSEKIAGFTQKLLGGEIYHYHSKFIMKAPRTGGRFNWHQDYGYWYDNGCLFPDMMSSTFLAYDKCDKENGCLQIIPGSHKLGRVKHLDVQDQNGADPERVEQAKKLLGLVYVELDPGDAIFFHCNLLHCSSPNNSARRRWSFIMCYNRKDNDPLFPHHHAQYTPMTIVPNEAIMDGPDVFDLTGKDFLNPKKHDKVRFQEDEKRM